MEEEMQNLENKIFKELPLLQKQVDIAFWCLKAEIDAVKQLNNIIKNQKRSKIC